jgi:methionyl-tRNA formyltransferase
MVGCRRTVLIILWLTLGMMVAHASSWILKPLSSKAVHFSRQVTGVGCRLLFSVSATTAPSRCPRAVFFGRVGWQQQRARPVWLSTTALDVATEDDSDKRKRVLFLGTPDVAATTLRTIHKATLEPNCEYRLVGVVTQPAKRRKRKGKVEPSPVGFVAEELGLVTLCPESAKDDDFLSVLENEVMPDVCITAAYGQYLPKRFLGIPKHGTLNIHPSLLPKWRGASPVQRSLEAGDNPVGVTVLFTVSKMDAGPIVAQQEVTIDENDTATIVLPMLFEVGTKLLLDALPSVLLEQVTMETATQQREDHATAARMIDSSEAELRVWNETAAECHNRARGFSMWPQTFLTVRIGTRPDPIRLKVLTTRVVASPPPPQDDEKDATRARTIVPGPKKTDGLFVKCYDGSVLELVEVQPPTKRPFPARDFQNGYPDETIRWVHPDELE